MTVANGARSLAGRFDVLAARGDAHLRRTSQRRALSEALRLTAPVALALAVILMLSTAIAAIDPSMAVLAVTAAAGFAFVFGYRRSLAGAGSDRAASLSLFDRQLAAKDRLTAADQFLHESGQTDPFRAAAIEDATEWAARADKIVLPDGSMLPLVSRRTALLLSAAMLTLVFALIWHDEPSASLRGVPPGGAATGRAEAGPPTAVDTIRPDDPARAMLMTAYAALRERLGIDAASTSASSRAGVADADAGKGGASLAGGAGAADAAAGRGRASGGIAASSGASRSSGAGEAGGGGVDGPADGVFDTATMQAGTGSPGMGQRAAVPGNGRDGRSPSAAADAATRPVPARQSETAGKPAGAGAGRSGTSGAGGGGGAPAAPPAPRSPVQPPQGPGSRGSKGQSGNGNSGQGQSPGTPGSSGQGGQSSGQEGAKRASGVSALLLALPTRDRLTGIAGSGPSRSTSRQAAPQREDAGAVAAGDRGRRHGDAGLMPQRPAMPYEDRLVRDYFARRPASGTSR